MDTKLVQKVYASRCIRTTMIGSIDAIEKKFGHLWNHGTDEEELSDEEKELKELFMELRIEILDLGNEYIRKIKRARVTRYE